LDNKAYQKLFTKDARGYGRWYEGVTSQAFKKYDSAGHLDYNYYIDKLDLVNRKNRKEFDMLFFVGIDPLSPFETSMVGRAPLWVNGGTFTRDCDNFVIVTPAFARRDGSIENIGHMAENMLGYNYVMIRYNKNTLDGTDYDSLNDWQKYCLCKFIATTQTQVYGYGMVHFSPNSESDYDWNNNNPVPYYKNWQEGKDVQDFKASSVYMKDSFYAKHNDVTVNHHRWWFYNMPYKD